METLIVHNPEGEMGKKVKAVLTALGVAFETAEKKKITKKEKPYNPEFVEKILESQQQYKDGKYTAIKTEDLWK